MKLGDQIIEIISVARGEKTNNNVSLKTPIKTLDLDVSEELKNAIEKSIKDFKATLFIENLQLNLVDKDYKVNKVELNLDSTD